MVRSSLPIFTEKHCYLKVHYGDFMDNYELDWIEDQKEYRVWYLDEQHLYIILTPKNSMVNNRRKWDQAVNKEIIIQNRLSKMGLYCCEANKATIEINDGNMRTTMKTIVCRSDHYVEDKYSLTPYYQGLDCYNKDTDVLEYQLDKLIDTDIVVDEDHSALREGNTIVYYRPPCLQFNNGKKSRFTYGSVMATIDMIRESYL